MKWVLRTTSVRVSDKKGERLYDSLEQTPEELREKIVDSLNGSHSQTILIANQKAYDEIADGGEDMPEELRRLKPALLRHRAATESPAAAPDSSWKKLLSFGVGTIVLLWSMWLWALQSGK